MLRRVAYLAVSICLLLGLSGCALSFLNFAAAGREAWRGEAERVCMSSRLVTLSSYIQRAQRVDGNGSCGIDRPLRVTALANGQVELGPDATLGCPMTVAIEHWLQTAVQPAALARFGSPVVEIKQMSAYACRTRNHVHGAALSEHAFGNALDIGSFKLANGREVTVLRGWRGAEDERAFLREVHYYACQQFNTVLGPGTSDGQHENHFHLDLAHHNAAGTSRYCRPTAQLPPPPAQPPGVYAPDVPMAALPPSAVPRPAPGPGYQVVVAAPVPPSAPVRPMPAPGPTPMAIAAPGPVPPAPIPAYLFQ